MSLTQLDPLVVGILILALAFAVADWILAPRPVNNWRWTTKGAVPALLVLGGSLQSVELDKPSWSAVFAAGGLALCLAGDLFLLEERRFVTGGVAFACAHVLFIAALLRDAWSEGWPAGSGVFVALALVAVAWIAAGWRVVGGAKEPAMKVMTGSYLVLLSLVLISAGVDSAAPGGWLAVVGAAFFLFSDLLLTWRRNVRASTGDGAWVMVTYHVALFCFAGWAILA